uniref:Uncharacterized protein n=1 Tax=Romanomermis culicivorax TaxID=13658 RepID=A0A915JC67_ROMCU
KSAFCGIADAKQFRPSLSFPFCFQKSRGTASRVGENWVRDLVHKSNIGMAESGAFFYALPCSPICRSVPNDCNQDPVAPKGSELELKISYESSSAIQIPLDELHISKESKI